MELGIMQAPDGEDIRRVRSLGITWANCGMSLDDPDSIYAEIENLAKVGIKAHGIVPYTDQTIAAPLFFHDFSAFLRQCAKLFPFESIEVWPEPNCPYVTKRQFGRRDYHDVIRCAYESWKEVRPETQVYNGGIGQHGGLWTVHAFIRESIDYTDGLNLHLFQFDGNPGRVVDLILGQVVRARLVMDWSGIEKPILCTEWGYPSSLIETSYGSFIDPLGIPAHKEETQAWIIREVLNAVEPFLIRFHIAYINDVFESPYWGGYTGLKVATGRLEDYEGIYNKLGYEALEEWVKLRNYN